MRARTEHGTPNIERRTSNAEPTLAQRKRLRLPISHLPSSIFQTLARVVEWQTRTFEGRMPKGMRVQVPPRAQLPLRSARRHFWHSDPSLFGFRHSNAIFFNGILSHQRTLTIGKRLTSHNHKMIDFYAITQPEKKFRKFYPFFASFWLSGNTCIWYKNRTHIPSRMNTPHLGPIIEVASQPSEVGGQNETRVSPETKTATHPFGSVLLRLELALSLICIRRTPACPAEARTRVRSMG